MKFLSVHEVARRLGLNVSTVYEKIRKGKIPAHRFGGSIRVSEQDLEDYIARTKMYPEQPVKRRLRPTLRHIRLRKTG